MWQSRLRLRLLTACVHGDGLQGQYSSAIKHLQRVLEISREMGDHVGDADAYGTIADIYTDMGDLEAVCDTPPPRGTLSRVLYGMFFICN